MRDYLLFVANTSGFNNKKSPANKILIYQFHNCSKYCNYHLNVEDFMIFTDSAEDMSDIYKKLSKYVIQ